MYQESEHILLASANIAPTPNRVLVLRLFLEHKNAFSLNAVVNRLFFTEKSTVFRTLQLLESKGILHSVVTDDGIKNYALCAEDCAKDNHAHLHAHLKCINCKLLYCVPITSLPVFKATNGIQIDNLYILANGTCKECNRVAY
jgi:Fe2+ or Zn2+ uptake regulation protein